MKLLRRMRRARRIRLIRKGNKKEGLSRGIEREDLLLCFLALVVSGLVSFSVFSILGLDKISREN